MMQINWTILLAALLVLAVVGAGSCTAPTAVELADREARAQEARIAAVYEAMSDEERARGIVYEEAEDGQF